MRAIARPAASTLSTYNSCISGVADPVEKADYAAIAHEVEAAGIAFEAAVRALTLHQLVAASPQAAAVSREKLKAVYTAGMVGRAAGRAYYDGLLASAPGGKCPLCSVGEASTLDHYAPKAKHPMLSVVPVNIVPACSLCNHGKLAGVPTKPDEHTLHPYFDDVDAHQWLFASVNHTSPPSFAFCVVPPAPPAWTATLADRVNHHFSSFKLNKRFALNAAHELISIKQGLVDLLVSAGAPGVHAHLSAQAASRLGARRNSWETAMYAAMASDPWFVAGGFR